jgi:serine/threonine protein kinase
MKSSEATIAPTNIIPEYVEKTNNYKQTVQRRSSMDELQTVMLQDEEWRIPKKYQLDKIIGTGSYGVVASATNLETGEVIAIKKNRNIFPQYLQLLGTPRGGTGDSSTRVNKPIVTTDKDIHVPQNRSCISQLRILREIKILKHLKKHPNIITLHDLILPESFDKFTDVYIVTDFMEADLRDILETSQLSLEDSHIQYFTYQLLLALHHLHGADILHRDMKPENILVNSDCQLRICDFGLARGCNFEIDPEDYQGTTRLSTNYVQTRWYRAPELLLNSDRVGKAIDVWSVGCIMAELLNQGQVLFAGSSTQDQLCQIIKTMGTPEPESLHGSKAGIEFIRRLEYVEPNEEWYLDIFPRHAVNPAALDLLGKLLQFDYKKRITTEEALQHEYFASLRGMKCPCDKIGKFDFEFEKNLMVADKEDLLLYGSKVKRECYETILEFHGLDEATDSDDSDDNPDPSGKKKGILAKVKNLFKKKRKEKK